MLANFGRNVFIAPPLKVEVSPCPAESGACLIVGTAPCWREDYDAAMKAYPDADVCLVNEASRFPIPAKHFATCHPEKIDHFLDPDSGFVIHVRDTEHAVNRQHIRHKVTTGSSSAMFAAVVMASIGYDRVILCGCPMNGGGGYSPDIGVTHDSTRDDPRVGFISPDHPLIKLWHNSIAEMREKYPEICGKVRSMSGHTKQAFGGIDDDKH